ncbi:MULTISPECIES: EAL domain-containing protein [Serratia]|uniref:EAL domain-containing protein n=1 Tax=Serratia TaxID=613 RepID=UPI00217A8C84|nr:MULTISPECIES: EAL domain-containing protein [Serratia]CAI1002574.1 phage resistance protein [Serratia quinivorans]CAI1088847.1 phage resistance protein [Serratia quinivorans]CAI2121932.1 phage resistance protein [Serratia quinivorans]CAI2488857.1 phage resistance protein [Serratia liquefaciens]
MIKLSYDGSQPAWICNRRAVWIVMGVICGLFWVLVGLMVNAWLLTVQQGEVTLLAVMMLTAVVLLILRYPALCAGIRRYRVRQLRRALARGDIRVWYQPTVTGALGHVSGCELLARWHLRGGRIRGAERFIALAEENGLIVPMTRLLVRQACRDLARMQARLPVGFTVSVNLSAAHVGSAQFLQDCRRLQRTLAGRAGRVTAEVGERAAFSHTPGGRQLLMALRGAGVRVMLDDFATGYQTLEELDMLPVDGFKIDQRHVRALCDGSAVSKAELMIRLGHLMSLELEAEGVETWAQHEWLLAHGVVRQQGYYFSPPLQAGGFTLYLANGGAMKGAFV